MTRNHTQHRTIADSLARSTKLTDTSGNPSESYHFKHLAALQREWWGQFWRPSVNPFDFTLTEIESIERRVRMELYP